MGLPVRGASLTSKIPERNGRNQNCTKFPHEHPLEGAGNAATSELSREMGNQQADSRRGGRRSGAEKEEQTEQWSSRGPTTRRSQDRRVGHSQHPNTRDYR
ncbi:hypothetical protein TNCV_2675111 [Trichonephila clavipes]|nr:hypothetical protein TNCV_2675111 [Trichonephila clavipes]